MQPRLKSSKKWTAFPKEYSDQIQGVFTENFAAQLADGKLIIEGRIYPGEVTLRVGIQKKGELRQRNFEVSMDYSSKDKDVIDRINNCVDAAASVMMDYFENDGEMDLPLVWKAFPFEKQTVYLQTSTENTELEAEANKLLGLEDDNMVQEIEGEENEPTDDTNEPGPRMFGNSPKKKKLH